MLDMEAMDMLDMEHTHRETCSEAVVMVQLRDKEELTRNRNGVWAG